MKKFFFAFMLSLVSIFVFAQADLQPLVVVKLNKPETITLKQLRSRVEVYQKQNGMSSFTVEQKKEILEAMIDEKLVVQAAQKEGAQVTDSQVNQYFLQAISQQIGQNVTESEFADLIKRQTGLSLDDFMIRQVGMPVSDYKSYLKNQLIAQQYVISRRQDDLQKIAPSDEEIRAFYELNKASFVQNDMLKLFLVIVPKKPANPEEARSQTIKLLNDLKGKKTTIEKLKSQAMKEEGKNFQAGDIFISKTANHAEQLGVSYQVLLDVFTKDVGFISDFSETDENFQFYQICGKYGMKMLGLSDLVQPETTTTVYEYVRSMLTQQKQSEFLLSAVQDITKELNTPKNVERKKTDAALEKLLDW